MSRGDFVEDIWSREQTKSLQGIACLGVMLHHLTQTATNYMYAGMGPVVVLNSMGILFTSIFFFFSGYGLIISVTNKKNYIKGFLLNRLPVIIVPFYVINVITILVRLYYNKIPMPKVDIIRCLSGYILLNGNGWYIVEIFFLYIAFYVAFKVIKNKDIAITAISIFTIAMIVYSLGKGHDMSVIGNHWFMGEWWFNTTGIFIMGMVFARLREPLISFLKKHYAVKLTIVSVAFVFFFAVEEYIRSTRGYYNESIIIGSVSNKMVTFYAQTVLCIIWMLLILMVCMKLSIGNKVIAFVAGISMELFLIHGLFLHDIFTFAGMPKWLLYFVVILCSVFSAYLIKQMDAQIIRAIQSLNKGKDYLEECEIDLIRERKEHKAVLVKRIMLIAGIVISVLLVIAYFYKKYVMLPYEFKAERIMLEEAEVQDRVKFGRYEMDMLSPGKEHVQWIVLKKEESRVMLVSEFGMGGSAYNNEHIKVSWEDSDLCKLLNTTIYDEAFSNQEKEIIMENPENGDYLSLLSANEATELFENNESRQINLTPAAEKEGTNLNIRSKVNNWDNKGYRSSWWWLRGDLEDITAPIVTVDGEISHSEKYVNKPGGAVRPVIWVSVE